jgi:hypothetical protein
LREVNIPTTTVGRLGHEIGDLMAETDYIVEGAGAVASRLSEDPHVRVRPSI